MDQALRKLLDNPVLTGLLDEFGRIKSTLARAQEVTGVKAKIEVIPAPTMDGPIGIGVNDDHQLGLVYRMGITRMVKDESELEAIIAHELAHVHYGDVYLRGESPEVSRANETRADLFAVQYGYGKPLLKAFATYGPKTVDDPSHPSMDERINTLKSAMDKGVSANA